MEDNLRTICADLRTSRTSIKRRGPIVSYSHSAKSVNILRFGVDLFFLFFKLGFPGFAIKSAMQLNDGFDLEEVIPKKRVRLSRDSRLQKRQRVLQLTYSITHGIDLIVELLGVCEHKSI